jgi:hypothetical protein
VGGRKLHLVKSSNTFVILVTVEYSRFIYPPYDAPLVEAYGNRFESVFVILHPFVRVPDQLAWKTTKQYPTDEQILSLGEKSPWAHVAAKTGLHDCAKLNQALLTSIGAIKKEFCDYPARDILKNFLESESVWMPNEGQFETLLQLDFLDAFEAADQQELIFVPEFPDVHLIRQLNLPKLRTREDSFPSCGTLTDRDASFLFTVDWDSFFTLFYGPREFISEVVRKQNLDGFFATPTTEHNWFNYSLGCCVVTLAPDGWPSA